MEYSPRNFISRGSKVWEFNPTFDIRFTEKECEALPPVPGGPLSYQATMGKCMKHSREPNVDFNNIGNGWANRDIQPAEELTCDYCHFMADVSHIAYL